MVRKITLELTYFSRIHAEKQKQQRSVCLGVTFNAMKTEGQLSQPRFPRSILMQ